MTIDVRPPAAQFFPNYISGRWYGQIPTATTTRLLTASRQYFFPVPIFKPVAIASISVTVTTGSTANGKARLGLYSDTGTGVPVALLGECSAEVAVDATATVTADFSAAISVPAGIAWLSMMTDASGTAATVRGNAGINGSWLHGGSTAGSMNDAAVGNSSGYIQTITYGAMGAVGSLSATAVGPILAFKVS
jgi:hypothetical protein